MTMLNSQQRGLENLLKLQGYVYRVVFYTASLSELTIRADPSGDTQGHYYRIIFQTTQYLQTRIHWEGDFCLASAEQKRMLTEKLRVPEAQGESMLLVTTNPATDPETLIFCHNIFVSQEIPIP